MNEEPQCGASTKPAQLLSTIDAVLLSSPPGGKILWKLSGQHSATVLREAHEEGCQCSYCTGFAAKGFFGLSLPEDKAPNSWRVIWWRCAGMRHYIRWTLSAKKAAPYANTSDNLRKQLLQDPRMTALGLHTIHLRKRLDDLQVSLECRDYTYNVDISLSSLRKAPDVRAAVMTAIRNAIESNEDHDV